MISVEARRQLLIWWNCDVIPSALRVVFFLCFHLHYPELYTESLLLAAHEYERRAHSASTKKAEEEDGKLKKREKFLLLLTEGDGTSFVCSLQKDNWILFSPNVLHFRLLGRVRARKSF
jgi:hypothetical protein